MPFKPSHPTNAKNPPVLALASKENLSDVHFVEEAINFIGAPPLVQFPSSKASSKGMLPPKQNILTGK